MVLVEFVLAFGFQMLGLFLDILLFSVVAIGFLLEMLQRLCLGIAGGRTLGRGQAL